MDTLTIKTPCVVDACGCSIETGDRRDIPLLIQCPLHASAPDLLAALEAFDKDHGHTMSMPRERCPYCAARAAIRKAKGGA